MGFSGSWTGGPGPADVLCRLKVKKVLKIVDDAAGMGGEYGGQMKLEVLWVRV